MAQHDIATAPTMTCNEIKLDSKVFDIPRGIKCNIEAQGKLHT